MKLVALKALAAAIEEGSLRAAALRMGVSQPGLTKMVRELESQLAAPLLVRTTRGVVPTAQGQLLYEHTAKVLRELGSAVDGISQLGGRMVGELKIGAVPLAVMLLIPQTLRTFSHEFPDIRLRVTEELYIAQLQRLRTGEVDLAIGGVPEGLASGEFQVEPLITTDMVVVVRRGSPLAGARTLRELAQARWVYTGASGEASGYARTLYESHGLAAPPVGAVVNSTLALLAIAATSDCVALLPAQIAASPLVRQYLDMVPLREGGLPLQVGAIVRGGESVTPALRHFLAHLRRAAHHLQSAA